MTFTTRMLRLLGRWLRVIAVVCLGIGTLAWLFLAELRRRWRNCRG